MKKSTIFTISLLTLLTALSAYAEVAHSSDSSDTSSSRLSSSPASGPAVGRAATGLSTTLVAQPAGTGILTSSDGGTTSPSINTFKTGRIISIDRGRNLIIMRSDATGRQESVTVEPSQFSSLSEGMRIRSTNQGSNQSVRIDVLSPSQA